MTTSDHRHATDKQETTVVAGCPNGCQSFELETSGDPDAIDELVDKVATEFGECSDCGAEMGHVRQDEPKEVLE